LRQCVSEERSNGSLWQKLSPPHMLQDEQPRHQPGRQAGLARTRRAHPGKALTLADWARLQDAVIAASIWALDPEERRLGLDGPDWLIERRRKDISWAVSRWSPRGTIYDLGHLIFELAGPPSAEVSLKEIATAISSIHLSKRV
jgi:hypothetical protein